MKKSIQNGSIPYLNALNARLAVVALDVDVNLGVAHKAEGGEAQGESGASAA